MIRVLVAEEPERFDADVRQPGLLALRELAGDPSVPKRPGPKRKRLPTLWTRALPDLRERYRRTCAYLGVHVDRGARDTVDHFVPVDEDKAKAYEWDNFRYALLDVNRLKGTRAVLDPFEVEDHWFRLNLATFEVEAAVDTSTAPQRWKNTLDVLNDPTFCAMRQWYHDRYFGLALEPWDPFVKVPPMSWEELAAAAPFVARALKRQGALRA